MDLPRDLGSLSIAALRAALADLSEPPPPRVRRALAQDPRRGVAALGERLEREERARTRELARQRRRLRFERRAWRAGAQRVAGVDEVGMGAMAGPVVAAAIILPPGLLLPGLDDSKRLDRRAREALDGQLRRCAVGIAVGEASAGEVDRLNVHHAGLLAMRRAVDGLRPAPEHLLVDARTIPDTDVPQEAIVRGDARSASIAAASIVAKVRRDAILRELGDRHRGYGFERHFGYATAEHREALRTLGPCPEHRTGYAALDEHAGRWSDDYYALRGELGRVASRRELARWERAASARTAGLTRDEARRLTLLARRRSSRLPPEPVEGRPEQLRFD